MRIIEWFKKNWISLVLSALCVTSIVATATLQKQTAQLMGTNVALKKALDGELTKQSVILDNGYKYYFNLSEEMNVYLNQVCILQEVNIDLAYSILMIENPTLNALATNLNSNGTIDIGLFQMNDKYIWTEFVPKYWNKARDPDMFNWRDNMYIAVAHISDLYSVFQNPLETFYAYNGGRHATITDNLMDSTITYGRLAMVVYDDVKED